MADQTTSPPTLTPDLSTYEYRVLVKNGTYGVHKIITAPSLQSVVTSAPVIPTGKTFSEFAQDLRKYYAALLQPAVPYETIVSGKKT